MGQGSVLETFRIRIFWFETHLYHLLIIGSEISVSLFDLFHLYQLLGGAREVKIKEGFEKLEVVKLGLRLEFQLVRK